MKYYALFDVMTIAIGFVLRAIAGVLVINVQISPWLIIGVFLFALVLALGKRQHDLTIAKKSRDCLNQYTEKMIDSMITISVSLLLISYALYSLYVNIYILFTLPFAFYGVFRYIQLIYLNNFGGEGDLILKDRASLINLALWVVSIILILYYPEIVTKIATYISIS